MKQRYLVVILFFGLGNLGYLCAEQVHFGDYAVSGVVNEDLIVINGSVNVVAGDLDVNGDLKVTSGKVILGGGSLRVNGDLIVTNTKTDPTPANEDATVTVSGDLNVNGAVITRSSNGKAYVEVWDPETSIVGSLYAGRITTYGELDSYVLADHHITVTGSIVTKSSNGHGYIKSNGVTPPYGNVYAGSIYTNGGDDAYVHVEDGHLEVNGSIMTNGYVDSYIWAEGNIEASNIFTRSETGNAHISGEMVEVCGDIRTYALAGHAYVRARQTTLVGQEGTFEDIVADNIYTRGYLSAAVRAFRSIQVRGDIVTWETEAIGRSSKEIVGHLSGAYVSAGELVGRGGRVMDSRASSVKRDSYRPFEFEGGDSSFTLSGDIVAQNIITKGVLDSSVEAAGGIDVSGDIITKSTASYAHIYTNSRDIKAGNIVTLGASDAYVRTDQGSILVDHVITTSAPEELLIMFRNGSLEAYVWALSGGIEAEKIFTCGYGDSGIAGSAGAVRVKGPIVAKSSNSEAVVVADNDLDVGAISTSAYMRSYVMSVFGSIIVREDIRTESSISNAYVMVPYGSGSITARSIKTSAPSGFNDYIKADAGSASFKLIYNTADADNALTIKNAEFDLDKDHEWNSVLSLQGTCTIDGKGHYLNFRSNGAIEVAAGAKLLLKNIVLRNIGGNVIRCIDDTGTISLEDVTWSQTSDVPFYAGVINVMGDVHITGSGTVFSYESGAISAIQGNATLFFDRGVTFSYDTNNSGRLSMTDETSRLHFDGSTLYAAQDLRLINGTLVVDNRVRLIADTGKTIYFGNGSVLHNLYFDFGGASKLVYTGNLVNSNM